MEISPVHSLQLNGLDLGMGLTAVDTCVSLQGDRESKSVREIEREREEESIVCKLIHLYAENSTFCCCGQCYNVINFGPAAILRFVFGGSKVCGSKILLKSKWF